MNVIWTILATVLIFLLLIFVHEFGHFIVAKACKVRVDEFSLGMGPLIVQKKMGPTMYSLRWLPIGGYCALGGENEATGEEGDFVSKAWWQKILVLAAGATMNFLLCILLMSLIAVIVGTVSTTLSKVEPGSPAEMAGMLPGDKVIAIDDQSINLWSDVTTYMSEDVQENESVSIQVKRGSEVLDFDVVPEYSEELGRYLVGISPGVEHNARFSIYVGAKSTWQLGKMMVDVLGQLFTGKGSADEVSGPVGIVQAVSESVDMGIPYVAYLAAIISLNLGIINLLPFPALDGGRILFVIIRLFTGKAITDELEGKFHLVGMALLMVLLVLVTFNDIGRLIGH